MLFLSYSMVAEESLSSFEVYFLPSSLPKQSFLVKLFFYFSFEILSTIFIPLKSVLCCTGSSLMQIGIITPLYKSSVPVQNVVIPCEVLCLWWPFQGRNLFVMLFLLRGWGLFAGFKVIWHQHLVPPMQLGSSFFTELRFTWGRLQLLINILGNKMQEKEATGFWQRISQNFFY